MVLPSLLEVLRSVEPGLVHQSLPGFAVKLRSGKGDFGTNFLGSFTSVFDLETRSQGAEVFSQSEVESKQPVVDADTDKTEPLAITVVIVDGLHVRVFIKIGTVRVHLFLTFNILEEFGVVPPLRGCLNDNSVWLELLDKFLSALRQHGRLVSSSYEIDIFAIEAFGKMNERGIEAVVSV